MFMKKPAAERIAAAGQFKSLDCSPRIRLVGGNFAEFAKLKKLIRRADRAK